MKLRLFHRIGEGGEESARVRRFIVDRGLEDRLEFSNIAYEGPQKALLERIGVVEAPVLFAGEEVLRGADAILTYLARLA